MTERIIDPTIPGPAGLYFNLRLLSRQVHLAAIPAELAAREALERWCIGCGVRASFGFGCFRSSDGVWACQDAECQAQAEARAAELARAASAPIEPLTPVSGAPGPSVEPSPQPVLNLFGEAA